MKKRRKNESIQRKVHDGRINNNENNDSNSLSCDNDKDIIFIFTIFGKSFFRS